MPTAKPIWHIQNIKIYFFLAYASAAKQELTLRHCANENVSCLEHDLELLQLHPFLVKSAKKNGLKSRPIQIKLTGCA